MLELLAVKDKNLDISEIYDQAIVIHQRFDELCECAASYHNEMHVEAVANANDVYLSKIEMDDPLNLRKSFADWKSKNNSSLGFDDLIFTLGLVLPIHDLGNVCENISIIDGNIVPTYHNDCKYKAHGAEDRSINFAQKIVMELGVENEEEIISLARHLIDGTRSNLHEKDDLQRYVEVMDLVGGHLFSQNDRRFEGLINELSGEYPDKKISYSGLVNYTVQRFAYLVPEKNTQDRLFGMWERDLGSEVAASETEITYEELAEKFRNCDQELMGVVARRTKTMAQNA